MKQEQDKTEGGELIFGIRPVIEALEAGKEFDKLFIQKGLHGDLYHELKSALKEYKVPHIQVPVEKINRLTRKNHQGVAGFISPVSFVKLDWLLPEIYEKGEVPFFVILDRVTDVRNFGAICRTAECAGAHGVIIPERGSAAISGDAIKTSAGALMRIPVCRVRDLAESITLLKESGLSVFACTEKSMNNMYQFDLNGPCAVMMGSEEDGISNDLLKLADARMKIPMSGTISSLNVSVACGVMMFEIIRQRTLAE